MKQQQILFTSSRKQNKSTN